MLETAVAQLRFAASIALGMQFSFWSLDRLVSAMGDTRQEFGSIGPDGAEVIGGPALDEDTRRQVQLRRFRKQAGRAQGTTYYQNVFQNLRLNPGKLSYDDIQCIPITPKEALRDDPDAFVNRKAKPYLCAMTTGTTGRPTSIYFSEYELKTAVALSAMAFLFSGQIGAKDIVQISSSSRATLGNIGLAGGCARIGAMVYLAGLVEPAQALALLAEEHRLPDKKPRASVLSTYPSYLGALVESGLRLGYQPADFGLEHIFIGGEVVTEGLKARAEELFGPVVFIENYAMTETIPFGGTLCTQGHLHFETAHGLLEIINPETSAPALPGEAGTIVATPFPPFRETTLLLRYDTEDMVRPMDGPLTCELRHLTATTNILGKLRLSVCHQQGWTFPADVLGALESVREVPLPARCGFWAVPGGIAVEVVVRENRTSVRRKLQAQLEQRGVPLQELHLLEHPSQLQQPLPLRCDLLETSFDSPSLGSILGGDSPLNGVAGRMP
ncbi:MAG: phenylacetate--CoA ligase family protein [Dehalococcoidia bacterium]